MTEPSAIVHERFTEIAGSEHVVVQLSSQWPQARVYSSITAPGGVPPHLGRQPESTWLDTIHRMSGRRSHSPLMPLMPAAFRRLPLRNASSVVVSHHAFATQAVFATDAPVIAYVHSPARWAWDPALRDGEASGRAGRIALRGLSSIARRRELSAAPRLAEVVANSTAVADRVRRYWGRDARVVHPPVDVDGFTPDPRREREDYFLLAGRLVPYKRPDLAIRAARAAGVRLVVAGEGRAMSRCRALAGPSTEFLGRVAHDQLVDLHRGARALVMPGVEDFGIVPVEAMACGTPVLALGEGGALDTVVPGVTGELTPIGDDDAIVSGLAEAMREFIPSRYTTDAVVSWARRFSRASFRTAMQEVVDDVV